MSKVEKWIFLEGALEYADFVIIISKNKYIINIFFGILEVFFNAIKYSIFKIWHGDITEDQAHDRSHRYPICLNVNITKMVMKWNFSSACSENFTKYIRVDFKRRERWVIINIMIISIASFTGT